MALSSPDQPGSSTIVPLLSTTIAGPSMRTPAGRASRSYTATSLQAPPVWQAVVAARSGSVSPASVAPGSVIGSPPPFTSTSM